MKTGCDENLEAKVAERSERAKKLYRYVSDVARRVGDATATCHSINDLFSTKLEVQRQKLRDNCEKLLFLDPVAHGKKSLELLWRKVYYETLSAAKKLQEADLENNSDLFSHIVGGIGHFHNFITRIQSELKVQTKELDYIPSHADDEENINSNLPEEELQFGRSALHSCLIYLGDLSRYQAEIYHTFDPSIAARYYLQAAHIDMASGMPYNQLGNLYLDKNYNLDSVCYYIHCLSCDSPFEGAIGNLTKIFEKNTQFCEALNEADTLTQTEHLQNIVANFLSLIEIWYLNKTDTNIPQRCNVIAQELKMAMDFTMTPLPDINQNYNEYTQAIEEENINPSYLNGNLVHKIVQICLFTMAKMIEIDEQNAFACKAFTLALLSQLLQKLHKQLESLGLTNPAHDYKPRIALEPEPQNDEEFEEVANGAASPNLEVVTNGTHDVINDKDSKEQLSEGDTKKMSNGDSKIPSKKSLAKRRRRRRVASSESSDMSDADTESSEVETDENCSDEEQLSESSYHSEDESKSEGSIDDSDAETKEDETNGDVPDEILKTESEKPVESCKENINNLDSKKANHINDLEIQNFLLGDNVLPSLKLLQDWILGEKDLILSCGDSGESLFQCVVDLLNIFTYNFKSSENETVEDSKILTYARKVAKNLKLEYKTIPLPEDINLRGTNICKFDKDAAEWQILDKYKPSIYEENIIRILNFIDFGNQVAKIVPKIRYNRTMKIFYLKRIPRPKLSTKLNHKRTREWHNSKKQSEEGSAVIPSTGGAGGEGGLLARLGRLWLASRVRELERAAGGQGPALLALDAKALMDELRRVKQLLRAKDFVLLVPAVVLQELDDLKREHSSARDAIRWLELQLKSGSRFLRAQRPGQSKPLPLLKYPRKAPPHVQNFIQILEFCYHFVDDKQTQGGNGDPDSSLQGKSAPPLILLVGNEPGTEDEYKEFSLTGTAQSAGISVEYIGDFYSKWRQRAHKSGKKR